MDEVFYERPQTHSVFLVALSFAVSVLAVRYLPFGGGFFAGCVAAVVCGIALVSMILELSGSHRLHLDARGFSEYTSVRTRHYEWSKVSAFNTWTYANGKAPLTYVVFDSAMTPYTRWSVINRAIAGGACALTSSFGMAPVTLAALLNARREEALAARSLGPVLALS